MVTESDIAANYDIYHSFLFSENIPIYFMEGVPSTSDSIKGQNFLSIMILERASTELSTS